MNTYAIIHIYALLIEKLRKQKYTSLSDMRLFLANHDLAKSERTISRYLEQMRHEFGLEIIYNKTEKGYYFENSNDKEVDALLNFLHLAQYTGLEIESKNQSEKQSSYLHFDVNQSSKGMEFFKDILFSIKNRRYIHFHHFNYHTEKITQFTLKPILLKQYQYRWYLVGLLKNDECRTFGCDRILDLQVDIKTFPAKNTKEIRQKFEQIIGLNYENQTVEKIRLLLTHLQAKYLESSPLHASQHIESDSDEGVIFALNLIPNFELIQRILMMGDQVKVLEPKSLQKEVLDTLKSALKLYK
ncbi:MAG: WYL domain-containing protein [Bacteroidia bacterium]|nr:WYL domain-containing protein [Bacteroidia bacterium]